MEAGKRSQHRILLLSICFSLFYWLCRYFSSVRAANAARLSKQGSLSRQGIQRLGGNGVTGRGMEVAAYRQHLYPASGCFSHSSFLRKGLISMMGKLVCSVAGFRSSLLLLFSCSWRVFVCLICGSVRVCVYLSTSEGRIAVRPFPCGLGSLDTQSIVWHHCISL